MTTSKFQALRSTTGEVKVSGDAEETLKRNEVLKRVKLVRPNKTKGTESVEDGRQTNLQAADESSAPTEAKERQNESKERKRVRFAW